MTDYENAESQTTFSDRRKIDTIRLWSAAIHRRFLTRSQPGVAESVFLADVVDRLRPIIYSDVSLEGA
jgi:hypothetical protein